MVEGGRAPAARGVALRTIRWEASRDVRRIGRSREICLVTRVAGGRCVLVAVVGMALRTGDRRVHPRKRIIRVKRMVELRVQPIRGGMAGCAIMRQVELSVRRIVRLGEISCVAAETSCRCAFEYVVEMTRRARQCGVRSSQRIAGHLVMIKFGVEPRVHGVAGLAGGWELRRNVVEHGSQKILLMA